MATAKAWIMLGRPHTAGLTIAGALIGALLAPNNDTLLLVALAAWALAFHWVGFTLNNVCDRKYDERDPGKAHFPLVKHAIHAHQAQWAVLCGLVVTMIGGGVLAVASTSVAAALSLGVAILGGVLYNASSKVTLIAPWYISLSFAAIPAFGFFVAGGTTESPTITYVVLYAFLLMLHQIAYSGYLKDLATDPVSWLQSLGASATRIAPDADFYRYVFPVQARLWGALSRVAPVLLAIWFTSPRWAWGGVVVLAAAVVVAFPMPSTGEWDLRDRLLKRMAVAEVLVYWILVVSLAEYIDPVTLILLAAAPLAWFMAWNRYLWGTYLRPRV